VKREMKEEHDFEPTYAISHFILMPVADC
jgi:hypothetical protein